MTDHVLNNDRKYPLVPRVGVGIVVINKDKFLLIKRGQEPSKGFWTIPGGLVELGESLENAAQREIYEECNINVKLFQQIDCFELIEKGDLDKIKYHYIVLEFLAVYKNGILKAKSDAEQARWFFRNDLNSLNTSDKTISLIDKAFARYQILNNHYK